MGYNSVADNTGLPLFVLPLLPYCLRNTRFSPYSSSRSSMVIELGVNGKPICDFPLVINCNFNRIC